MTKQKQIDNAIVNLIDLSNTSRKKLFEVNLKKLLKLVEEKAYEEGRAKDHKEYMESKSRLEDTINSLKKGVKNEDRPSYKEVYRARSDNYVGD